MRRAFLLFLAIRILVGCASHSKNNFVEIKPTPTNYAWWLRVEYFPSEMQIRGIPVKFFSKQWCTAGEFTKEVYLKHLDTVDVKEMSESATFSITGRFNGKDEMEAISGVYRKCTGEKGNFLLTITSGGQEVRAVSVLEMNENSPGFMSLSKVGSDEINIWWCLSCDHSGLVKWEESADNFSFQESDDNEQ